VLTLRSASANNIQVNHRLRGQPVQPVRQVVGRTDGLTINSDNCVSCL